MEFLPVNDICPCTDNVPIILFLGFYVQTKILHLYSVAFLNLTSVQKQSFNVVSWHCFVVNANVT